MKPTEGICPTCYHPCDLCSHCDSDELSASEAICAFAGLLSTFEPPLEYGAHHTVYALFEEARRFIERNKLTPPREGWYERVQTATKPYEELRAMQEMVIGARPVPTFKSDLTALINRYSIDAAANTPDFMLTKLLCNVLEATAQMQTWRNEWLSRNGVPPAHRDDGPPAPRFE